MVEIKAAFYCTKDTQPVKLMPGGGAEILPTPANAGTRRGLGEEDNGRWVRWDLGKMEKINNICIKSSESWEKHQAEEEEAAGRKKGPTYPQKHISNSF